jgi:hypothetical protein
VTTEQFDLIIAYLDAMNQVEVKIQTYVMFLSIIVALVGGIYIGHRWSNKS